MQSVKSIHKTCLSNMCSLRKTNEMEDDMMKMKKFIAFALAALFLFTSVILTGCNATEQTNESNAAEETSTEETSNEENTEETSNEESEAASETENAEESSESENAE